MRPLLAAVLAALALVAGPLALAAPAQAAPSVRVHAIFSGPQGAPFHVGQPLQVGLRGAGASDAIAQVCWTPAPLGLGSCASRTAAPAAAGTQRVVVTLADGTTLQRSFRVAAPRRRYDGTVAATAHVVCQETTIHANARLVDDRGDAPLALGAPVARFQRDGGAIAVWSYALGRAGFVKAACLAPGLR